MSRSAVGERGGLRPPWAPRLTLAAGVALFVVLVVLPLAALAAQAIRAVAADPHALGFAVPDARTWPLLVRSLGLGLAVAVTAMGVATLAATVFWHQTAGWARLGRWLMVALAPIPAYVHALAWMTIGTAAARWLRPLVGTSLVFGGLAATWWVAVMAWLPLAVVLAILATESVPGRLVAAARVYRSDGAVFFRVVVPLARPLLLAGGALVFLVAVLDYSVASLFQVNVYALEIFVAFSQDNDVAQAFLTALPLLAVSSVTVLALLATLRRVGQSAERRGPYGDRPPIWPLWFRVAQAVALGIVVLQAVALLGSLVRLVGPPGPALTTLRATADEAVFSLAVAAMAALIGVPLALVAAQAMGRGGRWGRWGWLLVTVPLAVPASLVGIGLIAAWNRSPVPLYATAAMPVLAGLARFAPVMALVVYAQARRVDPLLVDAARVFQASDRHGWWAVRLPLLAPGLLGAACLGFALTLGELGATILVAPPGRSTLTLRIYNYLHFGASEGVAVLCLLLVVASVAAGLVAVYALARGGQAQPLPDAGERP